MEPNQLASLAIISAFISVLVQVIKSSVGPITGYKTQLVLFVLSLLIGAAYFFWSKTNFWQDFVGIVIGANAIYSFIIQYFEKSNS